MKTDNNKVVIASKMYFSDWLFFVSAILFNLTISGLYIAVKFNNNFFTKFLGIIIVLLTIPFTITLIGFIKARSKSRKIILNAMILLYLLVEIALDYILKIPFREILSLHIPYIIIFYAACYSMIVIAWRIDRIKGIIVLLTFTLLIISLIYMYA